MKNLKKYTKAELISKIQGLKQNPGIQSKLFDFFYLIKNFLVKITLLTLIFKTFKRFKILRRIWLILNTIVMSIFGISMLDIYGLSIISAFITEITSITGNIISYLTNTKFYSIISAWSGYKVETPTKISSVSGIHSTATANETSSKPISKVVGWFDKEEVIENNTPFYTNKYFIMGSFLLISAITYYYFGDEVKLYSISLWEWLRGRRPGGDPGNATNNANLNPVSSYFGLNRNTGLFSQFVADDDSNVIEISENLEKVVELVDKTKGKEPTKSPILTSPSLENLNSTAQESWGASRSSSPESAASTTTTIKPISISKIKVDTNVSSSSQLPPSNSSIHMQLTPDGYIDEAMTPNSSNFKPFVTVELIDGIVIHNYNEESFKLLTNKGVMDRMNWIESALKADNVTDLDPENLYKLKDKVLDVTLSYNQFVEKFNEIKETKNEQTLPAIKYFGFLMRDWLQKHISLIWPDEVINIPIGDKTDSPVEITKNIFDVAAHQPDSSSTSSSDSE